MKKYLLLFLLSLSCSVFAAKNNDITGQYTCKGQDPFANENYTGSLIVKKTNETFQFVWDLGKDGKYKGTGFYPKGIKTFIPITVVSLDKNANKENPYRSELQVYRVSSNGVLAGRWTFLGKTKVSPTEVCTKK